MMKKEFIINRYITLRMVEDKTIIYVNNVRFIQCVSLFLTFQGNETSSMDNICSIDEAKVFLDNTLEEAQFFGCQLISPEAEFWGHCSNLQAWSEHDYDTRLLTKDLAFPLLKKLTVVGDSTAKRVFGEEIALRLETGYPSVVTYLIEEDYLSYLPPNYVSELFNKTHSNLFRSILEEIFKANVKELNLKMVEKIFLYLSDDSKEFVLFKLKEKEVLNKKVCRENYSVLFKAPQVTKYLLYSIFNNKENNSYNQKQFLSVLNGFLDENDVNDRKLIVTQIKNMLKDKTLDLKYLMWNLQMLTETELHNLFSDSNVDLYSLLLENLTLSTELSFGVFVILARVRDPVIVSYIYHSLRHQFLMGDSEIDRYFFNDFKLNKFRIFFLLELQKPPPVVPEDTEKTVVSTQILELIQGEIGCFGLLKTALELKGIKGVEPLMKSLLREMRFEDKEFIMDIIRTISREDHVFVRNKLCWYLNKYGLDHPRVEYLVMSWIIDLLTSQQFCSLFDGRDGEVVLELNRLLGKDIWIVKAITTKEDNPTILVKDRRVIGLNLSAQNLYELSPLIWELKSLKYLNISSNGLSFLPEEVSQLKKLEILDVKNNLLEHLPNSITHLSSLKVIDFRNNNRVNIYDIAENFKELSVKIICTKQKVNTG